MSHSPLRVSLDRALRALRLPAGVTCSILFITLIGCAALRPAWAADDFFDSDTLTPSPISDRFALRAGFTHARVATELRLDPPGQPSGGTNLSGTRDLGFRPAENDGVVELMFRLRDRNRIAADFLELDQAGTAPLGRSVVFGSQAFKAGSVVSAALQWRTMGLRWTYAFIQNDRFELGAGVGLHLMDLDVHGKVPSQFASYETSVAGVLPTPVIESAWRITRRFSVTARAQYLRAAIQGTSGALGDFHADAQFRWVPNLSIGAGYSLVRLKLDSRTQSNPGLVGIRLRGPEVFVRASF